MEPTEAAQSVPAIGFETPAGDVVGCYVRDDLGRWHASVDYDGRNHGLACQLTARQPQTAEVATERSEVGGEICDGCLQELGVDHEPELAAGEPGGYTPGT